MPAAPDVQYVFDGAVELMDITADAHFYFLNIHPDPNGWVDDRERMSCASLTADAMQDYVAWHAEAEHKLADAASLAGLRASRFQLIELRDSLAHVVEEEIKQRHPGRRGKRKATSRAVMRRMGRGLYWFQKYRALWESMMRRAAKMTGERYGEAFRELNRQIERSNRIEHDAALARYRAFKGLPKRGRRKQERKIVTKSFQLLSDVTGEETARAFISGDGITIDGDNYNFICRRRGELHSVSHGSCKVTVTDKDGIVLADACVYFPDVPAMDQVASLALHVMTGNEGEIIRTANFFNISEAGYVHDMIGGQQPQEYRMFEKVPRWEWKEECAQAAERFLREELGVAACYAFDKVPMFNPAEREMVLIQP